ncbi:MAG: hypothetical protein AB8F78_18890, partial [Saprospiraceae bacterium]
VGILLHVVPSARNQCAMCNTIATEFVCNNFLWYAIRSKKSSKETLDCFRISSFLQIDINDMPSSDGTPS